MPLADNAYGKVQIRLVKVTRREDAHDLDDLTIDVRMRGAFEAAYRDGDNRDVLPTDTMRGTAYALAADHLADGLEPYAALLAARLLSATPAASEVTVRIVAAPWTRATPHAFVAGGPGGRRTATVLHTRDHTEARGGTAGLRLFKTAGAGFAGFLTDRFTTLAPTEDRLVATEVEADWRYTPGADYVSCARELPAALIDTFAGHESRSLQHTLHAMGEAALAARADIDEIRLVMPNLHHFPVDLSGYGMEDRGEMFVASDRPFGLIEGTVRR